MASEYTFRDTLILPPLTPLFVQNTSRLFQNIQSRAQMKRFIFLSRALRTSSRGVTFYRHAVFAYFLGKTFSRPFLSHARVRFFLFFTIICAKSINFGANLSKRCFYFQRFRRFKAREGERGKKRTNYQNLSALALLFIAPAAFGL